MKAAPEKRARALALKAADPDRLNLSIAREVGVTAATVWKWLHPERTREFQAADNAVRSAARVAWARSEKGRATRRRLQATYVATCVDCGGACGAGTRYKGVERCDPCNRALQRRNHEALLDRVERLWNVEGLTTAQVAAALGRKRVGAELQELRRAGRLDRRRAS